MKNLEMLALVARGLGPLKDEVVFVGGATIELYLDGPPALPVRATDDVDCVVAIATRTDYHKLEERLRALKFKHPLATKALICRWEYQEILVDVMPIEGGVLGFTNRWYPEGFAHSRTARLPNGQEIKIFSLPYLIASKIEAFKDRGHDDFIASSDMEDIVTILDGAEDFSAQIAGAPRSVRTYLQKEFQELLKDEAFQDGLVGNLPPAAGTGRAARARSILEAIVTLPPP
jgi:BMFP domain-containing protein YqiC